MVPFRENSPLKRLKWHALSHSFIRRSHVYPRMELAILLLLPSRSASPHFGQYSVPVPQRLGGCVGMGRPWLAAYRDCLPARRRSPIPVPTDRQCGSRGSNSQPLSRKSDALTTRLPSQQVRSRY